MEKRVTNRKTQIGLHPPDPQPKAALVKRGEGYPPGVPLAELEEMYRRERPGKSRDRLQAAVLEWRGGTLKETACTVGRGISTVHRWLSGMERKAPGVGTTARARAGRGC